MIIQVKVIPGSRDEGIEVIGDKEYKIKVKERPEKGKANARVIDLIAKHFEISKKDVVIKNPTSRKKIVELIRL